MQKGPNLVNSLELEIGFIIDCIKWVHVRIASQVRIQVRGSGFRVRLLPDYAPASTLCGHIIGFNQINPVGCIMQVNTPNLCPQLANMINRPSNLIILTLK